MRRSGFELIPRCVGISVWCCLKSNTRRYRQALHNRSSHPYSGSVALIRGRTGCGKSTLLQLLTRAWDPQQGEILLNDSPIASLNEAALRQTISVVPQRVHLFSATLRDNLLLASPGSSDEAAHFLLFCLINIAGWRRFNMALFSR